MKPNSDWDIQIVTWRPRRYSTRDWLQHCLGESVDLYLRQTNKVQGSAKYYAETASGHLDLVIINAWHLYGLFLWGLLGQRNDALLRKLALSVGAGYRVLYGWGVVDRVYQKTQDVDPWPTKTEVTALGYQFLLQRKKALYYLNNGELVAAGIVLREMVNMNVNLFVYRCPKRQFMLEGRRLEAYCPNSQVPKLLAGFELKSGSIFDAIGENTKFFLETIALLQGEGWSQPMDWSRLLVSSC